MYREIANEIQIENLRQEAETKRKLIEEKELTKRANPWGQIMPWAALIIALIAGSIFGINVFNHFYPKQQDSCLEVSDIVNHANNPKECPSGHISMTPININEVFYQCKCLDPK